MKFKRIETKTITTQVLRILRSSRISFRVKPTPLQTTVLIWSRLAIRHSYLVLIISTEHLAKCPQKFRSLNFIQILQENKT